MNKILHSDKHNTYASESIIGKYIYFTTENIDANLYYIFNVKSIEIINSSETKYYTTRCFLMFVPKNENLKSFLYDNYNELIINTSYELFELSFSEYVNTFRVFVQNDGKLVKDLPNKLIQDNSPETII